MTTCPRHRLIFRLLAAATLTTVLGGPQLALADGGGTFSLYDADRNGYLDQQEFTTFIASKRNRADVAEFWIFQRIDKDGDGRISEQELINALLEDIKLRDGTTGTRSGPSARVMPTSHGDLTPSQSR